MVGLTLGLCVMAFAFLALGMERHQQAVLGRALDGGRTRGFRIAGWCALVITLRMIVGEAGWAMGLVYYAGCTSLAAGIVYGAILWRQRARA
ncbi:DUF3325 domain-containing protein [Paraburkholderia tropica]|uniref:DUF3325 domain-containing protein n=1 Tax=Paraburkholderia tropica TaxID=92647 RepID=UPI002AB63BBA|nr:DUF3325 domain-containing protein [Paraburkholderia tropica]